MKEHLAIVVIGRNEGARLGRVLEAALGEDTAQVVFVDSASTDDSVAIANGFGGRVLVDVLDHSLPFTPGRGRNRGFTLARERAPKLRHVMFVDGDCVLERGFVDRASQYLDEHPDVSTVTGRLREDQRDKNAFHKLADMEWDMPIGDALTIGGICMMRADVFEAANGFDCSLSAGEEYDLALRVRRKGYRIVRLPYDMARHDIDMQSFAEWWQRSVRAGTSLAEGLYIRSRRGDELDARELISAVLYGGVLPVAAAGLALPTLGLSLGALAASYPLLFRRVVKSRLDKGASPEDARLYAAAIVLGKFAGTLGAARFVRRWVRGELQHGKHML